jgi:hypothetical protein
MVNAGCTWCRRYQTVIDDARQTLRQSGINHPELSLVGECAAFVTHFKTLRAERDGLRLEIETLRKHLTNLEKLDTGRSKNDKTVR